MSKWQRWHQDYDDPSSSLSGRLQVVRRCVQRALADRPDPIRLISLCAGDGRDTIPAIAESGRTAQALLVELDPVLAEAARLRAGDLDGVTVRTADAGLPESFTDYAPASIFLLCGVFGNIADDDLERTIGALPSFLSPDGLVIWTRGDHDVDDKVTEVPASERVRRMFAQAGFDELEFTRPDDAIFRVGLHRWPHPTAGPRSDQRLFSFLW